MIPQRFARLWPFLVLLLALLYFLFAWQQRWSRLFAYDFALDWTAATALRAGMSLYDAPQLRHLGQQVVGAPEMSYIFQVPMNSYADPPSTALLFVPFTFAPFPLALAVYRLLSALALLGAVFLASQVLPQRDRLRGRLWGTLGLLLLDAVSNTLQLGQLDAWVTLALAGSLWAAARGRWLLSGAAVGVAALLKVSPLLILVYYLLNRKWAAALGAVVVPVVAWSLAALLGRPQDLGTWIFMMVPLLADGSLAQANIAFPAWLARLILPTTDPASTVIGPYAANATGLGVLRYLSVGVALAGVAAVGWAARRQPLQPLAISLLILVALITGPITWDHYATWVIIPLVQMADSRLWVGWSRWRQIELGGALLLGGLLLALPFMPFAPAALTTYAWLRIPTGLKTLGLLAWLGVGLLLLAHPNGLPVRQVPDRNAIPAPDSALPVDGNPA